MKFLSLIISVLLFGYLLCGCHTSSHYAPGDNTIPPPSNVYVGMPLNEFNALCRNEDFAGLLNYVFMYDDDGNPVVVTDGIDTNGNWIIDSVVSYDKRTIVLSLANIKKIKKDMTVHEVVSLIGNPLGCFSPYGDELRWSCDGIMYCIKLQKHPDNAKILIVSDVLQEDISSGKFVSILD